MTEADFSQRKFLNSRFYKLERNGVSVTESSLLASHRFHVPFESIPPKAQEITYSPRKWLTASLIFTTCTLIAIPVVLTQKSPGADAVVILFWGGLAFVSWMGFFLKRTSLLIYAQNGHSLVFYSNDPTPEEVARFVRRLFESRNKYLRSRYAQFSFDEPVAERLNRLEFLLSQEVISEAEYRMFRKEQTGGSQTRIGPIGFAS